MRNSVKVFASSAIFASLAFGSALATPENGEYYTGASRGPISEGTRSSAAGGTVPVIIPGGESAYYEGLSRQPLDRITTGSISPHGASPVIQRDNGDYYQGL